MQYQSNVAIEKTKAPVELLFHIPLSLFLVNQEGELNCSTGSGSVQSTPLAMGPREGRLVGLTAPGLFPIREQVTRTTALPKLHSPIPKGLSSVLQLISVSD